MSTCDIRAIRVGELGEVQDGDDSFASLDPADIVAVQAGLGPEPYLGPPAIVAGRADLAANQYADVSRLHGLPHVPVARGPIFGDYPGAQARRRARHRATPKGYGCIQWIRKRIEEIFGWCKLIGGLGRARFVGRSKIKLQSQVSAAACNLLRMARLRPAN